MSLTKTSSGVLIPVLFIATVSCIAFFSCNSLQGDERAGKETEPQPIKIDTTKIPDSKFGAAVKYGRQLMLNTAYYIGPNGTKGKFLGNRMSCTNCHQEAGTKLFSFNLMKSHDDYPQYRAREAKILTLAERVNNCVMRPHNGKPLPLDGEEMVALLSYFKWINSFVPKGEPFVGQKNKSVDLPATAASPERGQLLYDSHCVRCHGKEGEGMLQKNQQTYLYPPLWGPEGYQPGSSMHRNIKQAQWLKANMPYDKATADAPFLTDAEALDIASFINSDNIHKRPSPKNLDYPNAAEKAIDYGHQPFVDPFTEEQHRLGPWQPIIDYLNSKGYTPTY
jgi:thiosulfate dehydrogenase